MTSEATRPLKDTSMSTGRVVRVTSAQRRAAAAVVNESKRTGRPVSRSVEKIANAKPAERS